LLIYILQYLVSLFEDTNLAAIHAKRVTMSVLFLLAVPSY
jgi:histone H3/H4